MEEELEISNAALLQNLRAFDKERLTRAAVMAFHSAPRNPKIADIFFMCGFIESWGRGYFKIKTICEEQNVPLPEPKIISGGFSAICNASESYKNLAAEYGIDGFVDNTQKLTGNCTESAQKLPRNCPENL